MSPGRLHVITDESIQGRFRHVELARLFAEAGADVVQYRDKRAAVTTAARVATAVEIRRALAAHPTRLVVNDRVDVAAAARADGVHLGPDDMPPAAARRLLPRCLIGATANDAASAAAADREPIDYLGVGPVFGTRSKARPAPMLGVERLASIAAATTRPVIAIGGVRPERVGELLDAGAWGVAVLSDVVGSSRPGERVLRYREAIDAWCARPRESSHVG